jgi:hypothetical protein
MWTWKKFGSVWESAESLPLADRGFRYGMSVFASLAIEWRRTLLLEADLELLQRAAADFGAEMPVLPEFDFSRLATGLFRFYFTAGGGVPCDPFVGNV